MVKYTKQNLPLVAFSTFLMLCNLLLFRSRTFSLPQKEILYPFNRHSSPKPLATTDLHVSVDLPILDIFFKSVDSYNMWPVLFGFFH